MVAASLTASADGYKDGIEYYKAGQYDNAITLLQRNMDAPGTDKALSCYYLGASYLAQGQKEKAQEAFNKGIAANAECGYNYVGLGQIDLLNGNDKAAEENFKKAQKYAKKNTEVIVDIARAYYNVDPAKFAKQIEKMVAKAHKDSKNQQPAIYMFEGDRLAHNKQWNDAATQYEQAIYFDEDNPEGYVKYANVYFYVNPQYAIQKLQELLQKNPNSALAQRELAEKFYTNDQWTKAAEQYGKYIDNPNHFPEDKARYAVLLYAGGNYQKAITTCDEVTAVEPNNFQVQRVKIRSYNDLKNYPQVVACSKTFFANPEFKGRYNASDYTVYADALMAQKDTAAYAKVLQEGYKEFPKNPSVLTALSDYYDITGDYIKSADFAKQAVENTEKPDYNTYFGATYAQLAAAQELLNKDPEQAKAFAKTGVDLIKKAIEAYPSDLKAPSMLRRQTLLLYYANGGKMDEAAFKSAQAMIERMEKDPKYADPTNSGNRLSDYRDAYGWMSQYYKSIGDDVAASEAAAQSKKYADLKASAQ